MTSCWNMLFFSPDKLLPFETRVKEVILTSILVASFETIVEMIYDRLPGQKADYGKGAQTAVSFTGGYLAGILCAIVSHPADVMVSKLNANRQSGEAFGAAMGRIYKDIGFSGLWNGLPVRIVMIGTLTGLQWMIYVRLPNYFSNYEVEANVILGLFQDFHGVSNYRWRCTTDGEEIGHRTMMGWGGMEVEFEANCAGRIAGTQDTKSQKQSADHQRMLWST